MSQLSVYSRFSKLSREEKIALLPLSNDSKNLLDKAMIGNEAIAVVIDKLSENTVSHFSFPMGIAPNIWMNGKHYFVPLVTEESSIVAAISKAARFWSDFGGFNAKVLGTEKKGQVHFFWKGEKSLLMAKLPAIKDFILLRVNSITRQMVKRGGGITSITLDDLTVELPYYYQLNVGFETKDAMGANFINSCLEEMKKSLNQFAICDLEMDESLLDINMAILSNYTLNCKAVATVSCPVDALNSYGEKIGTKNLALRLLQAVQIAKININRAVTHNKGIYNGIDALAIATGNDWRALEAGGHAYASRNGKYSSLTVAKIENNIFSMELELPLTLGTVGGITNLHPMSKLAMEILGNPDAAELMQLMAVIGLASNFSALLALTSTGIQKGHMKMHLSNILLQLKASSEQIIRAETYFNDKTVSFTEVEKFLSAK
jgi:hydroxymethylglutaryl-CoA reductase